jgi:hypothetical protein
MARHRKLARYKRTGIVIAGVGVALGVAAVILWPQLKKLFQNPSITVLTPTITPLPPTADAISGSLPYEQLMRGI